MALHKNQRVICVNGDWSRAIAKEPTLALRRLPVTGAPYYVAMTTDLLCQHCNETHQWVELVNMGPVLFLGARFRPAVDIPQDISALKFIERTCRIPEQPIVSPRVERTVSESFKRAARALAWWRAKQRFADGGTVTMTIYNREGFGETVRGWDEVERMNRKTNTR